MGGAQAMKRIPRIKFPKRHTNNNNSGSTSGVQVSSNNGVDDQVFFSSANASKPLGGKASLQPKRTPMSNEEIEAILLGGCI